MNKKPTQQPKQDTSIPQYRFEPHTPGYYSNQIIRNRNGGVKHRFEDNIGGCSSNYR